MEVSGHQLWYNHSEKANKISMFKNAKASYHKLIIISHKINLRDSVIPQEVLQIVSKMV
jgi:hypothetical protein